MSEPSPPVVLIVEDERDLADLYADWLSGDYTVRTAYDGSEALEQLDEDVSVALLDRRMPDRSGDAVLAEIRDRDLACRVAMVTAVEPDFDVIDMGFDDYLTKPVTRDELLALVERLLRRSSYHRDVQEFFSLAAKQAVLEANKANQELADNEEYVELEGRLVEARERVDSRMEALEGEDFEALFRDFDPPSRADVGSDPPDDA